MDMHTRLTHLQPLLQQLFDLSCSPGASVGVLHQGVPVFTAHFGRRRASDSASPNDETLYNVASITKLMTAGVIANLIGEGVLDWDTPIREYLPEFAARTDELGQKATVTDLLANRTGLSAQNTFWGTMREDIFPIREQIRWMACHIPALGDFRRSFIYSSWGYGLVTSLIERVTGKPFSVCMEKYIFQPLGMTRSTTNIPAVDNVVFKHWVSIDGIAHEFPWSETRGWSDETGFGGAVGARSSIKEVLLMYKSLLHAFDHQTKNNVDSTPGSPFKYARRILFPFIGVGDAAPEKQGYCLGTYRTQLPGNLSDASFNSILLQRQKDQIFGINNVGRVIYHQAARFPGYVGTMLLDLRSQTAIVVLANSLPLFDFTDIAGQLILGTILGEPELPDYTQLARSVIKANLSLFDKYTEALAKKKTNVPLRFPLKFYEGEYWNKDNLICYSVSIHNKNQLRVFVKGSLCTEYILQHWGGELFVLEPNREKEVSNCMWPFTSIKSRMFLFDGENERVVRFTWHHDGTPGSLPERLEKESRSTKL